MTRRLPLLPLLILLAMLAGCGGSADESASALSSPEPTRATSPTAAAEASPAKTAAATSETPAQVAARQLCENTEIIDLAFTTFVKNGPESGLVDQVRQFTGQFATYKATFSSDPKGAAAAKIVTLLERQGPGWEALYGEGETAYQAPKANGSNVDILGDQIEAAWPAAMTALGFTADNAPHAPVVYAEGVC